MITSYQGQRIGSTTVVTVVSDLSGVIYYHWYLDGTWMGRTTAASFSFLLETEDQGRVEVIDTSDAAFDPVADAPLMFPARRTLWWTRSLSADVARYRVEELKGAGTWIALGEVVAEADRWDYAYLTGRLDDLTNYHWRVVPVDAAGNDGTPIQLTQLPELIVRVPDAPQFTVTYGPNWDRTVAAA